MVAHIRWPIQINKLKYQRTQEANENIRKQTKYQETNENIRKQIKYQETNENIRKRKIDTLSFVWKSCNILVFKILRCQKFL